MTCKLLVRVQTGYESDSEAMTVTRPGNPLVKSFRFVELVPNKCQC
jgi:hypothetical protein